MKGPPGDTGVPVRLVVYLSAIYTSHLMLKNCCRGLKVHLEVMDTQESLEVR